MENDTLQEVKTTEPPAKPSKPPTLRKDGQIDGRSRTSAANGAKGEHPGKPLTTLEPENLLLAAQECLKQAHHRAPKWDLQLTDRQARFLLKTSGLTREEFRDRLSEEMDIALSLLISKIIEDVNSLEPRDRPIAFGILNDHQMKMRGYATPTTINQTNIQINGMERNAAMAMLSGKAADNLNIGHNNRSTLGTLLEQPARAVNITAQVSPAPDDGQA